MPGADRCAARSSTQDAERTAERCVPSGCPLQAARCRRSAGSLQPLPQACVAAGKPRERARIGVAATLCGGRQHAACMGRSGGCFPAHRRSRSTASLNCHTTQPCSKLQERAGWAWASAGQSGLRAEAWGPQPFDARAAAASRAALRASRPRTPCSRDSAGSSSSSSHLQQMRCRIRWQVGCCSASRRRRRRWPAPP